MNSAYVQRASAAHARSAQAGPRFTRLASQQSTPGKLAEFFGAHSTQLPMPAGERRLEEGGGAEIEHIHRESLISQMPKREVASVEFGDAVESKQELFLTPSMRAWGVPLEWAEAREAELTK